MKKLGLLIALFMFCSDYATAQTPYFHGKTIRIIVGYPAASAHDLWARMIATQLNKHVPGNPATIVQNMPGAGSMTATNYIYSVAKPDGTTVLVNNAALYFEQLLKKKEVQYDWSKFTWIGTPEQIEAVIIFRGDSPIKTIDDLRKAAEPPRCGATGTGSTTYHIPKLIEELFSAKITVITGYQGAGDIDVALERGELQCRLITISAFFGREPHMSWFKKGFVRAFVQTGRKRDALLPDTPTLYELLDRYKNRDADRRLTTLVTAPNEFGRPWVAPPGMAPERAKTLRDGWLNTMKDADLLTDAKKRGWPVEAVGGEELAKLAKEVIAQPPEVIARLKKLLAE